MVQIPTPLSNVGALGISPERSEILAQEFQPTMLSAGGPLWTIPVPAGSPRRIGNIEAQDATWSPDGQLLLYCKAHDIYQAKWDGTESRKVLTAPGFVFAP